MVATRTASAPALFVTRLTASGDAPTFGAYEIPYTTLACVPSRTRTKPPAATSPDVSASGARVNTQLRPTLPLTVTT